MLIKKLSMFIKKYCVGNITSLLIKKCYAKGTIRVSFGKYNTVEEAEIIANSIVRIIE